MESDAVGASLLSMRMALAKSRIASPPLRSTPGGSADQASKRSRSRAIDA